MEVQRMESQRVTARRPMFSAISWGAILAGIAVGLATHMLLTLFGIAAGLTAYDPGQGETLGRIPIATGVWAGVSMLISAFVGGYVAARMSGLLRLADGIFHGFVAWGATTLLFAYLTTTALGSVLGGAFSILSQGMQGATAGIAASPGNAARLESMIKGVTGSAAEGGAGTTTPQTLRELQDRLSAGDRPGAINVMTNRMGFPADRATQIVDQALVIYAPRQASPAARDATEQAVSSVAMASWWLFFGVLLSLALGVWGGALGVRMSNRRTPTATGSSSLRTT